MLTNIQAILFGGLQGITELFPISSLGHTVILPQLFRFSINQYDEAFVIFIVATHVATACVLLAFYYKDWLNIAKGFLRSVKVRKVEVGDTYARLAWLIIVATIPAGALGLAFDKRFESLFARPSQAALFLIANGGILYGAELLRRKARSDEQTSSSLDEGIAKLSYKQAVGIGAAQALALFPGISRTGSSLAGGLLARLNHEEAIRFSFLLATPLIFAAGVLKLPKLLHAPASSVFTIVLGSLVSAAAAYVSVSFLSRYFKTKTLIPFAVYCVVMGIISYILIG